MSLQSISGREVIGRDNYGTIKIDPATVLSGDLMTIIFSSFPITELANLSLVSRQWKELSENKLLWVNTYLIMYMYRTYEYGKNFFDREACARRYFDQSRIDVPSIKKYLSLCKATSREADECLKKKVKTADEFNMMALSMAHDLNIPTLTPSYSIGNIGQEINQKWDYLEKLKKGFAADLRLRRVGLSSMARLEEYANKLKEEYGGSKAWSDLGVEFVSEGRMSEAIQILDEHLDGRSSSLERMNLIKNIVNSYCEQSEFIQALGFFHDKRGNLSSDKLNMSLDEDCYTEMINRAQKAGHFDYVEQIMDEFYAKHQDRYSQAIMFVIKDVYEAGERPIAVRLITKYQKQLKSLEQYEENDGRGKFCHDLYLKLLKDVKKV